MNDVQAPPAEPNEPSSQRRQFSMVFKGTVVGGLLVGFVLYRVLFPTPEVVCIYDAYFDWTIHANRELVTHPDQGSAYEGKSTNSLNTAGKAVIGTGQVLMDLWIGIFGIVWIIKVKNLRAIGSLAIFFAIRAFIFLNVIKFPFPDNIVWRSPGFFSFTVPYDHTRDFFYSGHTGTSFIIFLEMVILELWVLAILSGLSCLYMINMLLITQVHWMADIVGGLVFSVWCYRTCTRIAYYIDSLLSLPFTIGKWVYLNHCQDCCCCAKKKSESGDGDFNVKDEPPATAQTLIKHSSKDGNI